MSKNPSQPLRTFDLVFRFAVLVALKLMENAIWSKIRHFGLNHRNGLHTNNTSCAQWGPDFEVVLVGENRQPKKEQYLLY